MRLILGTAYGHESPVEVFSPIVYLHAEAEAGAVFELPGEHEELAVYVVSGAIELGGERIATGQMAVLADGQAGEKAGEVSVLGASRLMILGGASMGKRFIEWNFVASTRERIETAKQDWRDSIARGFEGTRFAQARGESEYIPLPGDLEPGEPPEPTPSCPTT